MSRKSHLLFQLCLLVIWVLILLVDTSVIAVLKPAVSLLICVKTLFENFGDQTSGTSS